MPHRDPNSSMAWVTVSIAWLGSAVGSLTLSTVVLILTGVFTALQIYILVRRLRREIRMEKLEAKLKHEEMRP